jgi:beta-lactamase regulating signal transducer with metallopeptidase domain
MIVVAAAPVLTEMSKAATGSLVAAVWQGVLLAGAAAVGLKLLPKTPAAARFAIWFGVFLLVTVLPVAAIWPRPAGAAASSDHGPWLVLDERWCVAIVGVWAIASLLRAITLVVAAFRVRALWKRATPIDGCANPTHGDEAAVNGAPIRLGAAARGARVCVSDEVDRPTVIGFFAPKILIPAWLLEKLTPAELEQVVLHEAGHLGRADDWMNLIQKIALVLFPLNPVLAWVERRLCFERELAVDERVVQTLAGKTGAAKAYAECLANLAEYRLKRRGFALGLVLGLLGRESELGKRIVRLLERRDPMKPAQTRLLMGGAMLVLLMAATGFEHCPQLVGFSGKQGTRHGEQEIGLAAATHLVTPADGFRAMPVRATVVSRQEWKTTGDATPQLAKANTTRRVQTIAHPLHKVSTPAKAIDVKERQMEAPEPYQVIETVSSTRQVLPDGQLIVTRWVAVTSVGQGNTRVVQTAARPQNDFDGSEPQQTTPPLHRYAAVPVQGGWLVFQL